MLEKLFTSKARIRILNLLLFNQASNYHLRELAKIVNVSPIYASKELDNLKSLNLINKSKKGNLSIYSINPNCILIPELRQLFIKTDYLGEMIKKDLEGKVKYAFIYGSFALGTENPSSDVDLFIIGEINEDEVIRIVQKLEKVVGREINYIIWSQKLFSKRVNHYLIKTIKKDKIIMLVGDENEFRKKIR